jgi:transketolase
MMMTSTDIDRLARQLAADSIRATTAAGSGHPTSCLSAAHLVATILGRHIRLWPDNPEHPANDRLVFSKGHAAPLLYAGLVAIGEVDAARLDQLRQADSPLEGHPVPGLPHVPLATGSLGQGLANGLGIALGNQALGSPSWTWVLLGDSEMTEGSVWEAMALASYYALTNLTAVVDVNRLGQRGPTMYEWDTGIYEERARAFGWRATVVDGHDPDDITRGIETIEGDTKPGMLIARTVKGHGVSFLADEPGRHGKALTEEEMDQALSELNPGERETITLQNPLEFTLGQVEAAEPDFPVFDEDVATRDAFGTALAAIVEADPLVMVLDGEVSNSTMTEKAHDAAPEQFVQMYIAEQAMIGAAVGLQATGIKPVASTFAAFLTRAHDFIRMGAVSRAEMVLNGSHAGVSIGEDGPSQMGLDDISMMRATPGAAVLYPADGPSTAALLRAAIDWPGIAYIRTTREKTPVIYTTDQSFEIGGSHTLRTSVEDRATIVAAGITVHEAMAAAEDLDADGIRVRVVDAYSIQPMDADTMRRAMAETGLIVVAEDHSKAGGLGDAVLDSIAREHSGPVIKLGVDEVPGSAPPQEQRERAGISSQAMKRTIVENVGQRVPAL